MKKFVSRLLLFVCALIGLNIILLTGGPKDYNGYLYEYNHKVELLENTSQPRIIFIGGSNVAFGLDSKMLRDSLQYNIINFGLHAGIGIRYPFEDCLDYIAPGDIVVLQFEYENFYSGGFGDSTLLHLMLATDWRHFNRLNVHQKINIIKSIPVTCIGNLKRLINIIRKSNIDKSNLKFEYLASGFNEYGDEISHLEFPNIPIGGGSKERKDNNTSREFLIWLKRTIKKYELVGAKVIILPPVCIKSEFNNYDTTSISSTLEEIGYPYVIEPSIMALSDDYAFDTSYHMNREGRILNTQNIIHVLDSVISP